MTQELSRKPLLDTLMLPLELQARCNKMIDSDGLCACGRWLARLDAKFILVNPIPSKGKLVIAAYCFSCYLIINDALKRVHNQAYKEKRSEAELRG